MKNLALVVPLLLAALGLEEAAPSDVLARCVTRDEVKALRRSVREHVRCARLGLDRGSACTPAPPPACAGSGLADALEVVLGGLPDSGLPATSARKQMRCQRTALRTAGAYLDKRLAELERGRRTSRAARRFATVRRACDGVPVIELGGGRLPTAGDRCVAAVPVAGQVVNGNRLVRCSRASLERLAGEMTTGVPAPNVVLVMTDDQNVASITRMPRVLDLRARASSFTNAFVTTPVCAPSRASLLSAKYAHRSGVTGNFPGALSVDEASTLATWLHAAGYTTGIAGKYMNFAALLTEVPEGWDEWQVLIGEEAAGNGYYDYLMNENGVLVQYGSSPKDYSTDVILKRALAFIQANAERPFFLLFTPFAPHAPAISAPRHGDFFALIDPWRPPNWHEPDVTGKPTWVHFARAITTPEATEKADAFRRAQLASLLAVDEAFGKIEDTLETLGLTDNTVLIFTSDHGFHWGEHWWADKFSPYEESLRVPLVVSYPVESPEPVVHHEMVANIDIAPTIAELAGAAVPSDLDGQSFAPLLRGVPAGRTDFLFEMWGAIIVPPWIGVRNTQYKYINTNAPRGVTEELYDLVADPYELTNLAPDPAYADVLEAMRLRVQELRGS